MLTNLTPQPADKIIELMRLYREDPRTAKVDLGVGVYKDATGHTPVMRAVKAAEKRLWEEETTKTYVALAGDPAFADAMRRPDPGRRGAGRAGGGRGDAGRDRRGAHGLRAGEDGQPEGAGARVRARPGRTTCRS